MAAQTHGSRWSRRLCFSSTSYGKANQGRCLRFYAQRAADYSKYFLCESIVKILCNGFESLPPRQISLGPVDSPVEDTKVRPLNNVSSTCSPTLYRERGICFQNWYRDALPLSSSWSG
ncbi:hypothetical protein CLAIMM_00606 isoform 2 [Cladophialophora immunda]|nr:hypothetical protein CLAIMM_00606 isoform 1 [Cladophialophora immunda]OQU94217.1 hypothetical protein CLAIMM_00606 isoform 2 [Cladophialophora immunda]